jgi:hypothetical protein|tara:strand:+ start:2417 stop:2626 length:210 start_codon:yes stop_codon:yes gene_type:complete
MIDAVGAAQIVSSFKRQQYVGEQIHVSHVKHIERAGARTVESIEYVTYNAHGRNEEPYYAAGSTVDIII